MISKDKVLVFDIDGTICEINKEKDYSQLEPIPNVVEKLIEYKNNGFVIILQTARQMNTYDGNIGKINANTAKITLDWLEKNNIPYDEIHFGKPWCGREGFYIDDKAIRPDEFANKTYDEILKLINK